MSWIGKCLFSARGIVVATGTQIAVSFAWALWFGLAFNLGKRLIALHVCVVAILWLGLLFVLGLVRRLLPRVHPRYFRAAVFVVLTIWAAALLAIYVGDFIGNQYWNGNLPWTFFRSYLFNLNIFRTGVPSVDTWALPVMITVLIIASTFGALFAGKVVVGLDQLFLDGRPCSLFGGRGRTRATLMIMGGWALGMALAVVVITSFRPNDDLRRLSWLQVADPAAFLRMHLFRREPILALFLKGATIDNFEDYMLARCLTRQEPKLRAQYPYQTAFERKNVILITVDSLRPDHMQVCGYERHTTPFLENLKQAGRLHLVERTIATCPESSCGISSILSSKYRGNMVPQNFHLQDLLQDQGYNVRFILSDDHSYFGLQEVYGDSLTSYFDGASSKRYPVSDDRVIFEGLEGVPKFNGTPTFFYFHLMSAHVAGIQQEAYQKYLPAHKYPSTTDGPDDDARAEAINAYDNGVLQADAFIRGIFDWLRKTGYLDNALAVITADHGEELGEHGYGHLVGLNLESVAVPLAFYDDSDTDYTSIPLARQIDIAPTIVHRLGLIIPSSWQGRSLLDSRPVEYAFVRRSEAMASKFGDGKSAVGSVIYVSGDQTYQYIRDWSSPSRVREQLYFSQKTSSERNQLIETSDPFLVRHLRQKLDQHAINTLACDEAAAAVRDNSLISR